MKTKNLTPWQIAHEPTREQLANAMRNSFDHAAQAYKNGLMGGTTWKVFQHVWERLAYRLSAVDQRGTWTYRQYEKGGYRGTIRAINRVRIFWGFDPLPEFSGARFIGLSGKPELSYHPTMSDRPLIPEASEARPFTMAHLAGVMVCLGYDRVQVDFDTLTTEQVQKEARK